MKKTLFFSKLNDMRHCTKGTTYTMVRSAEILKAS